MQKTLPVFTLFAIIILEGYVVLSSELLAIRLTTPFVGAGTDTVAIIIAAVLVPLAFGYHSGGTFKPGLSTSGKYQNIRKKLVKNLLTALCILTIGLSYVLINDFFEALGAFAGMNNRLILLSIYAAVFIITPVYLLGQTIPLVSHYFKHEKPAKLAGKLLFLSTLGSFAGAILSTLVLMAFLGVHYTVCINLIILCALIITLSKKKITKVTIFALCVTATGCLMNTNLVMKGLDVVNNNQYSMATHFEHNGYRILLLNSKIAALLSEDGKKAPYINFIEDIAIKSLPKDDHPRNILVLGARGFTLGAEDTLNHYDYVDIDRDMKEISEKYILKEKLGENKEFHPVAARAFLAHTDKKYDVIVMDLFLGDVSVPEHLSTIEFFDTIKNKLSNKGIFAANFIIPMSLNNKFSRNIDNTVRYVFPFAERHVIDQTYDLWNEDFDTTSNVLYIYKHLPELGAGSIYTDNKNRIFMDKPHQ